MEFFKLFGDDPDKERPVVPVLPLSPMGQSIALLSNRNRLGLSSAMGNTPSNSPPNSPRPASPRINIEMVATPRDAEGIANDGVAWVTKLLVQMEALSNLSAATQAELMDQVPSLQGATSLAKQETLAQKKELGARRLRTSIYSALVMYWLTFGLGKVVGNTYGAVMVGAGLPGAALYAPLITMLGVPFMQVIFGEPVGGAQRGAGVSYGSPDQAAYINYQTAQALQMRAWIEGNPAEVEKYRKIMNGIVDGLIQREKAKKPDGGSRIPKRLRSNASVPERHADGTVKPGQTDPSRAVVGAARTRSFITDEVPVHTFTVLNAMSGTANMFWKLWMGSAAARVPDMVLHTLLGSIAMVSMFEWQNVWRASFQGVDLADGGHPAVLGAKKEAARITLELWRARCLDALALIKKIEDMRARIVEYRKTHSDKDEHWLAMQSYDATLATTHAQLHQSLKRILAAAKRAKKLSDELTTRGARANQVAKLTIKSMVGESSAPEPWLDGAPLTIRSIGRVLGYMTALSWTTTQAICLGQSLMDYDRQLQDARALATSYNMTLDESGLNNLGLSSEQMAGVLVTASTVAATAIVGWTAKTLYTLPMWEFGIHGIAGIATRAIKETRHCLGLAPDTTLAKTPGVGEDLEDPVQPESVASYSEPEEGLQRDAHFGLFEVNISGSTSSSSDHD
ncbi:MAG: hypothetical protein ACK4NM_05605 [Hydrogenophaga sp.]